MDLETMETMDEMSDNFVEAIIPIIRESFRAGFKAGARHAEESEGNDICD